MTSTSVHAAPPGLVRAFERAGSPVFVRRLALYVLAALAFAGGAMLFVPWRQFSAGHGRVIAYSPTERTQTIEAPVYGRVVRWGEGIVEGAAVKAGQFILEIRDIDAQRAERLALQEQAARDKVRFAESKVETYRRQEADLDEARRQIIEAGKALVAEAEGKVEAELQGVEAATAGLAQTKSNFERQKKLFEAGLLSGTSFEKDERSFEEAEAKLAAARAYVAAARQSLAAKTAELEQKSRESQTKVDYARAMQQEAQGETALAQKDLAEIQGKRAQFESRVITAPKDGFILRLFVNENAEQLKEGDPLFTIVPDTNDRAVELLVDGNDIPLVIPGRDVRIQFEGWPAVQFAAGWPTTAWGTFGGTVVAVDATDNGRGKFRVLVRPSPDEPWPKSNLLRQGVRANGWILLDQVTIGYEVWRQMNGFPAVYDDTMKKSEDSGASEKPPKKVKLPK